MLVSLGHVVRPHAIHGNQQNAAALRVQSAGTNQKPQQDDQAKTAHAQNNKASGGWFCIFHGNKL